MNNKTYEAGAATSSKAWAFRMKKRRLKQTEAAKFFAVRPPDISKMLRGEFRQFSVERLMRFLVKR